MARIVTWVPAETAARILCLSPDTVNDFCARGVLRARRASEAAPWQIEYDSICDYKFKPPATPAAQRAK
jgi:hypothetical protein